MSRMRGQEGAQNLCRCRASENSRSTEEAELVDVLLEDSKDRGSRASRCASRGSKDRGSRTSRFASRDSKDRGSRASRCASRGSKDRGSRASRCASRDSKDRGSRASRCASRGSKDRGSRASRCASRGSKDRGSRASRCASRGTIEGVDYQEQHTPLLMVLYSNAHVKWKVDIDGVSSQDKHMFT
uniref:Uncharacterized protein n=1 Tax=Biomphalaria glabrata TaxID=6526 RepID=A0A2C9LS59_BIOGL